MSDPIIQRSRRFETTIRRYTDATKTVIDPYPAPASNYEADLRACKDFNDCPELAMFTIVIGGSGELILSLDAATTDGLPTDTSTMYFDVKDVTSGDAESVLPEPIKVKVQGVVTN